MGKNFIKFFGILLTVFTGAQGARLAAIESMELENIPPYHETESTWDGNSYLFEFEDEVIKNALSSENETARDKSTHSSENEDAKSKNTGVKSTSPIEIKNYSEDIISWLENKNLFENIWVENPHLYTGESVGDEKTRSSEDEDAKNENAEIKGTYLFEFEDEVIKNALSSEDEDAKDKSTHSVGNEVAENKNAGIKNTSPIEIKNYSEDTISWLENKNIFENTWAENSHLYTTESIGRSSEDEDTELKSANPNAIENAENQDIRTLDFKNTCLNSIIENKKPKNPQTIDSQVEKNLKRARKNYLTCQKELSIYALKYIQARRAISTKLLEAIEANQNESSNFMRIFVNVFCSEIKCLVPNKNIPKMNLNLKINKSGLLECIIKLDSKHTYLFTV